MNAPALGNAALALKGETATLTLPDWSLASYRTWIALKAALPRVEVRAPRTIACPAADLARLGVDVRAALGGYEPAAGGDPLFDDQRYVVDVALRRRRFAIYAECGWGKTAAYLAWARAVAARTGGRKVLVVCPLRVVRQTVAEHAKFWPDGPQPANLRAVPGGLRAWLADPDAPALGVLNVDAFRRGVDLAGLAGIVLDEASVLKAMAGVVRNHLVRAVAGVEYRLACSATPAPNDLEEYVSQALFVGAVTSHKEFFADYFQSDGEGGWSLRPHARDAFHAFMASWSIWIRDPATYGFAPRLGGVPAPVFHDVHVPPTPAQLAAAREHRKVGHLFLDEVGVVKRGKLAQLARGFLYEDGGARPVASHKPAAVADAVCAHPGARAVVWVTFNEEGRLVAAALAARGRRVVVVDGATDEDACADAVARLEAGAADVLVAKPAAMGFGLNLQCASVVVFSGVSDSFEQDYQALRRCFRYGQTRAVHCYYVATDFEVAMLANVRAKRVAWEGQAAAMERAYRDAAGADLALYRGAAPTAPATTRYELSAADVAALRKVA